MKYLNLKAFAGLLNLLVVLGLALFLPAWTLNYWQAWLFLVVFSMSVLAVTLYLMKHDPKLLERRLNAGAGAERQKSQKIIQFIANIANIAFIAVIAVPPIDHRFAWSSLPIGMVVLGEGLVVAGLLCVFFVFRENTFTSAVIEVADPEAVKKSPPFVPF